MKRHLILVLVVSLLLLSGCQEQPQTPTTNPPVTQTTPVQTTVPTESAPDSGEAALVSLRQALVETPQQFAVAYLGILEEGEDPVAFIQEQLPGLCSDLPFLTAIGPEDTVGTVGELYCIVPGEGATVTLNRLLRDEYGWVSGLEEFLVRDTDTPFFLLCNGQENPDTELHFTSANGVGLAWMVTRNHLERVTIPYDDAYQPMALDFSCYEEMLETEYRTLAENGWFVPTAQDLRGTSWYWDRWVDDAMLYLEFELLFEESTAFVRWYDNNEEAYQIYEAAPWQLNNVDGSTVLTLDFGGFAGDRSYNVLMRNSGEILFIMSNVLTGEPAQGGESLCRYMARSDLSEAPDPMEMVGTWQRLCFEVEGYREDSRPGDVILTVQGASQETLTLSYNEKARPESRFDNRALRIEQRKMYEGCGNSRWVADVDYEGNYDIYYTVTLLTDGTLLLQSYWVMDSAPMVSYEWFERIG